MDAEVRVPLGASKKKVVVIGAGFAGLSAACSLAKEGFDVTVLERLPEIGGRCRLWKQGGYSFDLGPSWYWMPDVFDEFFESFGKKTSDYLELTRLDPAYKLFLKGGESLEVPDSEAQLAELFERLEHGGREKFRKFMQQAEYKYKVSMADYVKRPSLRIWEFLDLRMLREAFRLDMFKSQASHVRAYFSHPHLVSLMEWPVLFLGGSPDSVPAMYSLMNYAAISLGTWYPKGGMVQVPLAMASLAQEWGVTFLCGDRYEATRILVDQTTGLAHGVQTPAGLYEAEFVVAAGDYHHMEQDLLDARYRNLSENDWDRYIMSPSSLVFYLGVSKELLNLRHHNLFFDEDLAQHADEIYKMPKWPSRPLFYVCVQSLSEPACAPPGHSNVFVLIPLAAGLPDSEEERERFYDIVMTRLEKHTAQSVRDHVTVKRSYAMKDFEADYRSYKGNAYGLANTLFQTAVFKPAAKCWAVDNLYYAGQLTVPGPGVPPALISGQIVSRLITAHAKTGRGVRRLVPKQLASLASGRTLLLLLLVLLLFLLFTLLSSLRV